MATITLPGGGGLFDERLIDPRTGEIAFTPAPPDALHNPDYARGWLDQNPLFDTRPTVSTQPVGTSTDYSDRAAKIGFFDQLAKGNPDAWLAVQAKNEREQAAVREQNNLKRATIGAITQNPDLMWEDPAWISRMNPNDQWNAFRQYNEGFQNDRATWEPRGGLFGTQEFAQGITDLVTQNHNDPTKSNTDLLGEDWINDFVWGVHTLFANDPQGFLEWEKNNPEMAIRWHAQMGERFGGESNTSKWGIDKFEHNKRARQLAYQKSQDLGYGKDGKNDGKTIAANYKSFDDIKNKSGSEDFWKIGTPQSVTDGIGNWIEDNPWEAAGLVAAGLLAPQAGSLVSGAIGGTGGAVAGAATTGAVAGAGSALATGGNVLEGALIGAVTGGVVSAPVVNQVATSLGVTPNTAKGLIKAGSAVAQGKSPQDALINLGLDIGLDELDAALDNPDFRATLEGVGLSGGSASRDAILAMVEEGVRGGDAQDILLSGAEKYIREDGRLAGDFGLEVPDWLSGGGDLLAGLDLPSWGGSESINLPDFDMPNLDIPSWGGSESINLPDFDTPNWGGSESIDIPSWGGSESIDIPNIDAPNFDIGDNRWDVDIPDIIPDINTPGFGDDIPDNKASGETSIVQSLFSTPLSESIADLFGYTKLTPAQAAQIPAPINYVKGLFS